MTSSHGALKWQENSSCERAKQRQDYQDFKVTAPYKQAEKDMTTDQQGRNHVRKSGLGSLPGRLAGMGGIVQWAPSGKYTVSRGSMDTTSF